MMSIMSKSQAGFYATDDVLPPAPSSLPTGEMPPALLEYLRERRRAIITELRRIEQLLELDPSIPLRDRPH